MKEGKEVAGRPVKEGKEGERRVKPEVIDIHTFNYFFLSFTQGARARVCTRAYARLRGGVKEVRGKKE